jgi:hypothetical protein
MLYTQVTVAYLVSAGVLLLVVAVATGQGDSLAGSEGTGWIQGWARWDSGWYAAIAEHGYTFSTETQSSVAFFPSYPLLMMAGRAVLPVYVVGYLVTVVSGLISCLLFARWSLDRMPRTPAVIAVVLLMVYPYSYYLYGAVYSDALFLACTLGAFLLLDRGHPLLAGLVGICASAGRPVGIAVLVGLVVRSVELAGQRAPRSPVQGRRGASGPHSRARRAVMAVRQVTWRDSWVLLAGAGLGGWCLYQWVRFGNPLAFVAAQAAWDQGSGVDVWLKFAFFRDLATFSPQAIAKLAVPGVALILALTLLPRVTRRFGWGYASYAALVLVIPLLGSRDFLGVGRYLFVCFPVVAVAGELVAALRPVWLRTGLLAASAVGLVLGAGAYGAGLLIA